MAYQKTRLRRSFVKSGWEVVTYDELEWLKCNNYYLLLGEDRWELYSSITGQDALIFVAMDFYGRRQGQRIRREMEKYRKVGERCGMIFSS